MRQIEDPGQHSSASWCWQDTAEWPRVCTLIKKLIGIAFPVKDPLKPGVPCLPPDFEAVTGSMGFQLKGSCASEAAQYNQLWGSQKFPNLGASEFLVPSWLRSPSENSLKTHTHTWALTHKKQNKTQNKNPRLPCLFCGPSSLYRSILNIVL